MNTELEPKTMPSFAEIAAGLQEHNFVISPSEIHGQLCAYICAGENMNGVAWLDAKQMQSQQALFMQLYQSSFDKINKFAFDFQLLLPDDDEVLSFRARALGEWCQGFMAGIGVANLDLASEDLSEEIKDALLHIEIISEIDYENISIDNDDERAFFEVAEYIRLAVLMLHAHISGVDENAFEMMPDPEDTIH